MKKILSFLIISLFLISFTSAWSYDNSETNNCAKAYAKVIGEYPSCDGNSYGSYCAGKGWYVDLDFEGDKFYLAENWGGWNANCNDNGCSGSGLKQISDGRHYLDNNGEFPYYVIYAWDYDECFKNEYDYDWAWASQGGGYLGTGALGSKKNINCYKDVDCSSTQYCDKDGTWREWKCEDYVMGCTDSKAINYNSNAEKDDGSCNYECDKGEDKCEEKVFYSCENRKWNEEGLILNECNVECLNNTDCSEDTFVEDKFCKDDKTIGQLYRDYSCSTENKCVYDDEIQELQICEDACEDGKCIEWTFWERIMNWFKGIFT